MESFRIGQGIDIHRFVAGRPLILGGVDVPSAKGLDGHSDADVLLHALIDALLGAAGLGDIGTFFPNTDKQWKNSNSLDLLRLAWNEVSAKGYSLVNADIALVLEAPKISTYIPAMKSCISKVLSVDQECIGIKVTTAEGLGFVGREEGVLATAVALLRR